MEINKVRVPNALRAARGGDLQTSRVAPSAKLLAVACPPRKVRLRRFVADVLKRDVAGLRRPLFWIARRHRVEADPALPRRLA